MPKKIKTLIWGVDTSEEWLLSAILCFALVLFFSAAAFIAVGMALIYAGAALCFWDINYLVEEH